MAKKGTLREAAENSFLEKQKENLNNMEEHVRQKFIVLGYELPKSPLDIKHCETNIIIVEVERISFLLEYSFTGPQLYILPTLFSLKCVLDTEIYDKIQHNYNPYDMEFYSSSIKSLTHLGELLEDFKLSPNCPAQYPEETE